MASFYLEISIFQFTCLRQGLTPMLQIFSRLLKPVLSHLHNLRIIVMCYIDDCIFIVASSEELHQHVAYALHLFDSVGLTVNPLKSFLEPIQEVEFLGVVLNSVTMTATLSPYRKEYIKKQGLQLLQGDITLLELVSFIGLAVASDSAMELALVRYKYLEIIRNCPETLVIIHLRLLRTIMP